MERKNQYNYIQEGDVKLAVPENYYVKGPGKIGTGFYNMDQKLNRDFAVSFIKTYKPKLALDAFGGTGIRGIRFKKEANVNTIISETNRESYNLIKKNVRMNGENIEVYNQNFNSVMNSYLFDYVDLDPYGSVLPYVDSTLMRIKNGGFIGITATDLTALTGSSQKKAFRRYRANIINDKFRHESGIRLLIAEFVKRAAAMDKGAFPYLSLWHSHYYRVIFKIFSSANMADEALEHIHTINKNHDVNSMYTDITEGPIWTGDINKINFDTLNIIENPDKMFLKYLHRIKNEDYNLYFIELSDIAEKNKSNSIPVEYAIEKLRENGMVAGRTEFSETGIKVSSKFDEAIKILF